MDASEQVLKQIWAARMTTAEGELAGVQFVAKMLACNDSYHGFLSVYILSNLIFILCDSWRLVA